MRSLLILGVGLVLLPGCTTPKGNFYPLGIFNVPKSDLVTVSQAGFNLVTGPPEGDYLDQAQRAGVKVLAGVGSSAGQRFNPVQAQRIVRQLDAHPALWSWYLSDEPDLNQVSPTEVEFAHKTVKEAGAQRPTSLVLYQGHEAQNYANIADITLIDRYPIPWLPLANFPQHVRLARLAVKKEKPLMAVIQAFDWKYYPNLLPGEKNLRAPTYEELRCMTYCALARRANGVFYYCYNDRAWRMQEHPATWDALQRVISEVRRYEPLFRAEHLWWPYVHEYPDATAGFNEALESSISPTLLQVKQGTASVPTGRYLLTVNTTRRQFQYRIRLPKGTGVRELAVLGENRAVSVSDDWIEDTFGPLEVHAYGPLSDYEDGTKFHSWSSWRK